MYYLYITSLNEDSDLEMGFKSTDINKLLKKLGEFVATDLSWSIGNNPPNYEEEHSFWIGII